MAACDLGDMAVAISITGHFESGGDRAKAAAWALRAGQRAVALGAMRDAESHLERGLHLADPAAGQSTTSAEIRTLRVATLAELLGVRRALLGPNHPAVEATVDGGPAHSFATLLHELSAIVRNVCTVPGSGDDRPTFEILTTPNDTRRRALDLLATIRS